MANQKRIAVITGASSGMGREFALQIARRHLADEAWLLARNVKGLEETANQMEIPAACIPLDLTSTEQIAQLGARLEDADVRVAWLVNAAGFGKFGTWDQISDADAAAMIDLNCRAVTALTRACLPHMGEGGRILQLASCAAFVSLPGLNVYAATKAFVLSYTRALRWELHGTGITATAVCPAWVKTGFEKVARETVAGKASKGVNHLLFQQKASTVVSRALACNKLHFAVATCGIPAFLLRITGKFLPRCVTMAGWEIIRRI